MRPDEALADSNAGLIRAIAALAEALIENGAVERSAVIAHLESARFHAVPHGPFGHALIDMLIDRLSASGG